MPTACRTSPPVVHVALLSALLLLGAALPVRAAEPAAGSDGVEQITTLLRGFLATVDQAATHDRFWADDLVYTSAAGVVNDKPGIMSGFAPAVATAATPPAAASSVQGGYSAEDIRVRPYGDSAALTFRLVAHAADGSRSHFRNSGMLVRRNGSWQVVTWQATREPAVTAP